MGSILGIDVSKDSLDVVLISGNRQVHKIFNNNSVGHKHLHNWLVAQRAERPHVCLEATGQYGEAVAEFLYQSGYPVSVVNPARYQALRREQTASQQDGQSRCSFDRRVLPEGKSTFMETSQKWQLLLQQCASCSTLFLGFKEPNAF